jgi:hypothetical protein
MVFLFEQKATLYVSLVMNNLNIFTDIINISLVQEEFDTYDHNAHMFVKLQILKKRSKIIEIVAAKDIIFALAHSGLCAAFSRGRFFPPSVKCYLHLTGDDEDH